MENYYKILTINTLSDDDGDYELINYFLDEEKKIVIEATKFLNSSHYQYSDHQKKRILSKKDIQNFLDIYKEKIDNRIARELKINLIIN